MNQAFLIEVIWIAVAFIIVVYAAYAVLVKKTIGRRRHKRFDLARHNNNPILSPQFHREWESEGAFNPGAVKDDEDNVHLFYRALGADGISRIGHAIAHDGRVIRDRSPYPIYEPAQTKPEIPDTATPRKYDPLVYISGGGWGGAEDPRVVRIGDRVYMTYTAFGGWSNMRIGLTSISMKDLKNRIWRWKRPILISPPGRRDKNWVLFPEKINGKYAILHSLAPRVMVAYVDHPEMVPKIQSSRDHGGYGINDKSRETFWDKTMKGAGTPPIKTSIGWLILYHAIEDNQYKVGAMILDLNDPTKILYRSPEPILSPDMPYENDGKPGVVYATGAVVKDGKLFVYYGGGDKHTCVAETQLDPLLTWLMTYGKV